MTARHYRNAKVFTGVDETTFAEAFTVDGGRFTWVGADDEVPSGAEVVDLGGRVVLPGLIDAHTHPTYIARTLDAVACTPPLVHSIDDLVAALRAHATVAGRGAGWIEGWGYDESKLAEGRTPTRHDLDRVSTTRPVYVLRSDCHSAVCNTRALELAGVTRHSPDPSGSHFGRDPDGEPNGILHEFAANQVVRRAMGADGFDAEVDRLARTTHHLSARGIVACTDMFCVPDRHDQLDLYRAAVGRGFRQHVRLYYHFESLAEHPVEPITEANRTGRVAVGGLKLFMDGSVSSCTAWLRDPYRGSDGGAGERASTPELLAGALAVARRDHLQIAVHAMGDRAIAEVLDAYADEEPWLDGIPSVRLEHASVLGHDLVERIATARVHMGVATNIDFFFAEHESYAAHLTDDQYARTYPVRDLYRGVEALALSSDCPATAWADPDDPFLSIQAAVTRRAHNGADIVADQAVTVPQAVLLYTGRARLLGPNPGIGLIAPGFEASFVTMSDDVFEVDPRSIADIEMTGTWIGGERVHGAD